MSTEKRRIEAVLQTVRKLAEERQSSVWVGDVAEALRLRNSPTPAWQLRADLSGLEAVGALHYDADTGGYLLSPQDSAMRESA